jgi:CHAT domain-containing protein
MFARQGVSGFHPGLLSGLVLTGANRPAQAVQDEGVLTALEVEALDMGLAELVVLSACETGLGETAGGEGLLGLQRTFQVAGARSVVAGLWKVADHARQALMATFYKQLWDEKKSRLEALRGAQLALLKDYDPVKGKLRGVGGVASDITPRAAGAMLPPFYGAAFALSGDWR